MSSSADDSTMSVASNEETTVTASTPARERVAFMEKFFVNIAAELDAKDPPCEEEEKVMVLPRNIKSGPFEDIRRDDVLMGRGKFVNNRTGNLYYRVLLERSCEAYEKCTSHREKTRFTHDIVRQVQTRGRFVQAVSATKYVEISDQSARIKVGQALRYQDKLKKERTLGKTKQPFKPKRIRRVSVEHEPYQEDSAELPPSSTLNNQDKPFKSANGNDFLAWEWTWTLPQSLTDTAFVQNPSNIVATRKIKVPDPLPLAINAADLSGLNHFQMEQADTPSVKANPMSHLVVQCPCKSLACQSRMCHSSALSKNLSLKEIAAQEISWEDGDDNDGKDETRRHGGNYHAMNFIDNHEDEYEMDSIMALQNNLVPGLLRQRLDLLD